MAGPGEIVVGMLFLGEYRNGLKVWSQPAGPGTQVFPALPTIFPQQNQGYPQVPFAYPAQYYLGCSHPSNCLEIFQFYDIYQGGQFKAICCGQCSYIQQILSVEDYNSYVTTPIVVA